MHRLGAAILVLVLAAQVSAAAAATGGDTWSATAGMNERRIYHTATLLQHGHVLGMTAACRIATAEIYDPRAGTWR